MKAASPQPQLIDENMHIDLERDQSHVVSKRDKMRVIDEILIVSLSEMDRHTIRNSPSSGLISKSPKLTFSYPSSELT